MAKRKRRAKRRASYAIRMRVMRYFLRGYVAIWRRERELDAIALAAGC